MELINSQQSLAGFPLRNLCWRIKHGSFLPSHCLEPPGLALYGKMIPASSSSVLTVGPDGAP